MFTNHISLEDLLKFVSNPKTPHWHTITKKTVSEQKEDIVGKNRGVPAKVFFLGEANNEFTYEVELPGFSKEEIKVKNLSGSNKIISISASRKAGGVAIDKHASFALPRYADVKSVKASASNGILTIKIAKLQPKPQETASLDIPIS